MCPEVKTAPSMALARGEAPSPGDVSPGGCSTPVRQQRERKDLPSLWKALTDREAECSKLSRQLASAVAEHSAEQSRLRLQLTSAESRLESETQRARRAESKIEVLRKELAEALGFTPPASPRGGKPPRRPRRERGLGAAEEGGSPKSRGDADSEGHTSDSEEEEDFNDHVEDLFRVVPSSGVTAQAPVDVEPVTDPTADAPSSVAAEAEATVSAAPDADEAVAGPARRPAIRRRYRGRRRRAQRRAAKVAVAQRRVASEARSARKQREELQQWREQLTSWWESLTEAAAVLEAKRQLPQHAQPCSSSEPDPTEESQEERRGSKDSVSAPEEGPLSPGGWGDNLGRNADLETTTVGTSFLMNCSKDSRREAKGGKKKKSKWWGLKIKATYRESVTVGEDDVIAFEPPEASP